MFFDYLKILLKKCSVENDSSSKCSVWNEQFLCRPILAFHVYFVNPQKRWGVRCETQIAKDTCLGEYGGILRKDNGENNPDNNYLFSFHHVRVIYYTCTTQASADTPDLNFE